MKPRHPDELSYVYKKPSLDMVGMTSFYRCDECHKRAHWIEPAPRTYAILCDRCTRAIANLAAHEKRARQ
jgi:hypothetical protein